MRSRKKYNAAAVCAGWLVAFAGMMLGELVAGFAPPAASLACEAACTLLGGYVAAAVAGPETARRDLTLVGAACEAAAVLSACLSDVPAPAWFYAVSFLFPLPLALAGGGLRLALTGEAEAFPKPRQS